MIINTQKAGRINDDAAISQLTECLNELSHTLLPTHLSK